MILKQLYGSRLPAAGGVISLVGAGGKTTLMFRMARELAAAGETVLTTTTTRIYRPGGEQSREVVVAAPSDALADLAVRLRKGRRHVTAAAGYRPESGKLVGFSPSTLDAIRESGLFRWILVEADGAAHRPLKAPAAHEPVIPSCTDWVIGVVGLDAVGKPMTSRWVFRPERFSALTGLSVGGPVTSEAVAAALLHPDGILKGLPPKAARCVFLNKAELPGARQAARAVCTALIRCAWGPVERILIGTAAQTGAVTSFQGC